MKCVEVLVILTAAFVCPHADAATDNTSADENCDVVPMTTWAGEPSLRTEVLPTPVSLVVIQHTVTPEATTDAECEGIARAIRKYQMKIMQFDDIGQSFLVCGNEKIYEGAGWTRVGAHTKSLNKKALGVSFIGEFSSTLPMTEAIKAAQSLLSCGAKNGYLSEDFKVIGHRQVSNTRSPGDELQKEIEKWTQWTSQYA